ncbi:MAG: FAD-dependent oxidoreductase, partial [Methylocystis sp.]|nr:FAD-dependent oxidoreductase [Methylocystis sp.]
MPARRRSRSPPVAARPRRCCGASPQVPGGARSWTVRDERHRRHQARAANAAAGRGDELVLSRHAHPRAGTARGHVCDLCLLPRRGRHRRPRRRSGRALGHARRLAPRPRRTLRRPHSAPLRGLGRSGAPLCARSRRFRSDHRRHGDGRRGRHSGAGLGQARSLLRSCGERRGPPVGAHFRPGRGDRGCGRRSADRTEVAGPLPWACAPAHQYPARYRRGCAAGSTLSSTRGFGRGRRQRFLAARRHRASGARRGLRRRRREGARSLCRNQPHHRGFAAARRVHVVGAGLAGLACALRLCGEGRRVVVYEAAGAAGGRCRSHYDAGLDLVIDNGNHLLLSGNRAAHDYLMRCGAAGALAGPNACVFDFLDARSGERWRLRPNASRWPWWIFVKDRRAPGTKAAEYLGALGILRAAPGATIGEAMACSGLLYERLWRPVLLSALNTDPREASAGLAAA